MHTGVSGDMILGALFDLGLDFRAWKARMDGLGLPRAEMEAVRVNKAGIMATRFTVRVPDERSHRGLGEIRSLVSAADLPEGVKDKVLAVFARLAGAEAGIHGVPVEEVHFHEVGALDSIIDVVGACLGFDMLGVEGFFTTPFTFGNGTVRTRHGLLGVPVPATLALSRGFPSVRTRLPGELCTPTGTALVTSLARPVPSGWMGILRGQGYGAGSRDLPGAANVLRICLMDAAPDPGQGAFPAGGAGTRDPDVYQVECNLDNMAPELLGYALERLFDAGCKDAWQEPIHMKKNRSAVKLCALAGGGDLDRVLAVFASETSTGGIRYFPVRRLVAAKGKRAAETRFGTVDLKEVTFPGQPSRLSPEYESCRRLALAAGVPLQAVYREAQARAAALEAAAQAPAPGTGAT